MAADEDGGDDNSLCTFYVTVSSIAHKLTRVSDAFFPPLPSP